MKKRIPTLVLFGVVFLVFSILLGWKSCAGNKNNPDRDYDGVLNIEDSCPDQYAKTANGCPIEIKSQLGTDKDNDGRFAEFQKDTALFDPNDNNACIPNPTCDFCDEDGDGLTYPQEIAKRTKPTEKDSDQDRVNDGVDNCPLEYGIADNNGCKLVIDVGISRKNKTISWYDISKYANNMRLIVTEKTIDGNNEIYNNFVSGTSVSIGNMKRGFHYSARLIITLENPRAVQVKKESLTW
jgi:hypothetical protein